ncbi:MAG: tRNA (guanosine(37)-N1)-methyltransferase TrmD [Legionellales bacterium RIFCSPHIGHO2_12_FULL_37_14]|nr:MAG: tRNA (guanosine(37)-N1)-methyltransferase TrmD [Legionellales bacterium RIFCSPHIGHO2_12_FULL_37_14]
MLKLGIVTLLPELFKLLNHGMIKKAITLNKVAIQTFNPRDFAKRPYCQVDDTPYGGGPGMVLCYEPLHKAITFAKKKIAKPLTIYLSPEGKKVKQQDLNKLVAANTSILFIAGRYEGIDERVIIEHVDEEWSIGDFVLSGGEFAAMVFIDALVRLIPGVLGHEQSAEKDAFMQGYFDYPQYTKPALIGAHKVPSVLLEGNHAAIEKWRKQQALGRTWLKRPELLENMVLTKEEKALLENFKKNYA